MTHTGPSEQNPSDGNWWKRRGKGQKVLIIGGAIIVLTAILGSFLPDPEETTDAAASTTTSEATTTTAGETPDETTTTEAETTTTVEETTTTVAETTTTDADLPGIGDAVRDGKFEFVVTEIEQPGKVYDPENVLEDEANGVWFIVYMTVENIGDESQTFFSGDQKVFWDDKEFEADGFAWNGTNAEELNPGIVLEATVMFDVPESFPEAGVGTMLELHDSVFSGGVNVYL